MIVDNTNIFNSPVRNVSAKVELFNGSTLTDTFTPSSALKSFSVERQGEEGKFFGFGICQKLKLELVDKERQIEVSSSGSLKSYLSCGGNFIKPFPMFHVEKVARDENTNGITVEAYDALYTTTDKTLSELGVAAPYTIGELAAAIAISLGVELSIINVNDNSFNTYYEAGANFEGTETIREVLTAIAEATQTIYYLDSEDRLIFKRLDISGNPVINIDKANYFNLESQEKRTLTYIVSATELGDNVGSGDDTGAAQYIRNNPFWDLREDIAELVDAALAAANGLTITEFSCSWRGNFLIEPGDKLSYTAKDDSLITTYLLNDTLNYGGGLSQESSWTYEASNEKSNPSTLGESLKLTYARVDKANKEIEIVAGEAAALKLTTDGIQSSVTKMDNDVTGLTNTVNTKVTSDDVSVSIQSALEEGVEKVITSTGFTFNEEGLYISKSNSEITTTITEDGMTVYKKDTEVLVADNQGVKAEDLHATTFLVVGNNSRFEDYGTERTGCFWIGN